MHMEPIIKARRFPDRLRYPETGMILALVVMAYVNAAVQLVFG